MADFPYAEAYPEQAQAKARDMAMQRAAFHTALSGLGGGAAGMFGRLRRPMQAATRGPRPGPELASELERMGGTAGPGGFTKLTDLAARGQIDRPWPGIYRGPVEAGRTVPPSYAQPREYTLPDPDQIASIISRILPVLRGR